MGGTSYDNGVEQGVGTERRGAGSATAVGRAHLAVDMTLVGKRIRRLHDQVCGHGQRVEVTRAGCDDVCVMISKRELEAMETALAYYASHTAHVDTCRAIAKLLAEAGLVYAPQSYADGDAVHTFADDCAGAA